MILSKENLRNPVKLSPQGIFCCLYHDINQMIMQKGVPVKVLENIKGKFEHVVENDLS